MLNRLYIKNYALIDSLDISFDKGLNILTGETGAGKSIILGALGLILGQRAESKYFFNQQKKCVIEGFFNIEGYQLNSFFEENDLDFEKETVLRREISLDGKSRAFVNDTPVNLTVLKQLGEQLIDIHSQHATLEIGAQNFQLLVTDLMAANQDLLKVYKTNFKSYKKKQEKLDELIRSSEQAKADLDYFQFQFNELEQANLLENEQETLESELNTLTHAEEIKNNLTNAYAVLEQSEINAVQLLKEASSQVQLLEKYQPELAELNERLKSSIIEIRDISSEIYNIDQSTAFNEERFVGINDRLNLIYSLQKKHRVSSNAELISLQKELSDKLNNALFIDEDILSLQNEIDKEKSILIQQAQDISERRKEAAPLIENFVQETLANIGMPDAQLKVDLQVRSNQTFDGHGIDNIKFLFTANKGHQLNELHKVASGGELSRLMLSIKSLIAKKTALPTIIFDEIDTGVSGEVAHKVGNIMEQLAQNMQVITITHLPQMASKGNSHFFVYKEVKDGLTYSQIKRLSQSERVTEIAKMLSGENPGESAFLNAKELLKLN
ncbi:DNA replication and repair protein RecN [Pseudopedobacter saltans DSM 12145]|uniref:DNA repair protein RecN n=1 Tax=Pseudopedobacter saltans (strain ATCC 51119 / DSM 12145 / JCM 21818 / CCUG 39354 / LMG 10337 / NBRC 100064 / NCIMB 13643) TaxID=762903 RepID=F0S510_PSESL|nr:DNA repair protein RecN [Pseudopedobacter saltans]ADY50927.1 DNA replication and repair protein RecN [Pseudopedobacter saltans DSM 12145]